MKLIRGVGKLVPANQTLLLSNKQGSTFEFSNERLSLLDYSFEALKGSIEWNGQSLLAYESGLVASLRNIREGLSYFKTFEGKRLDLPVLLVACLSFNIRNNITPPLQLVFKVREQAVENGSVVDSLVKYDPSTDTCQSVPFATTYIEHCGNGYCANTIKGKIISLVKYRDNLEIAWEFEVEGDFTRTLIHVSPLDNGSSIIINLCTQEQDRKVVDGEIFCLTKDKGDVIWRRKFPLPVQDCQLLDDERAVVFTENRLITLSRKTGEVLQTIETDFEPDKMAVMLFVHKGFLFLFHARQHRIYIYEAATLNLIRKLDGTEEEWRFRCVPEAIDGKIYIEVMSHRLYPSLLIIDPQDIQSPLEIEADPDFQITGPSKEHPHVLIESAGIRIDDVVRFGETVVLEHIRKNGRNFFNPWPNKTFNGHVELRCSGYGCEPERAKVLLDMMVARVKAEVDFVGYRAGKGKTQAYLTYVLG